MEIRRYIETLLIWARAKKDNLVYTLTLLIALTGLLFMIYSNYKLGITIGLSSIFILLLAIVWNE